jgi:hypothetical protein
MLASLLAGTGTTVPARGQKPVAPPPRLVAKDNSHREILVGTWKFVSRNGRALARFTATVQFGMQGQIVLRTEEPERPVRVEFGQYKLHGNSLVLPLRGTPGESGNPAREAHGLIETLNADKLVFVAWDAKHPEEKVRQVLERVPEGR